MSKRKNEEDAIGEFFVKLAFLILLMGCVKVTWDAIGESRMNEIADRYCKSIDYNGATGPEKNRLLVGGYSEGQEYCYKYITECKYNECKIETTIFEEIPEEAKEWWNK